MKNSVPMKSPVEPAELVPGSEVRFDCHRGVACFNACCRNVDITLTPWDIVRIRRRLAMTSREFVARYTVPFAMDAHGMPGLKLATRPGTSQCVFLREEGCGIYADRPAACRYYPLGNMGMRPRDSAHVQDIFFVVREDHCLGHQEPRTQSVAEYRREQGIEEYDDLNREWRDVILKKRSSGSTVGAPSERSLQLFDMCSYDMDSFRAFVLSESFRSVFDLDDATIDGLNADDEALLRFSMRLLKQILFGEQTIPLRAGARETRIAARRQIWAERQRGAEEDEGYRAEGNDAQTPPPTSGTV